MPVLLHLELVEVDASSPCLPPGPGPPHSRGALSSREEALRDEEEIEMMMKNVVVVAGEQHDRQERELR